MSEGVEIAIALTAKDLASQVIDGVGKKFGELGTAGKLAAAGIGAIVAGSGALLGGLTALANKSAAAAGEIGKLKRETGLTAVEASKLRAIGERLGLSTDDLSKSFGILSKSLESAHPSLEKYNIKVVETSKGHVDMDKTLANVADRFKSMPDGVEKTALSMDIFGKTGKDLIPLLNKGSEGLKEMGDEAARLGLVFDDKALAAAKRYGAAQKDLGENIEGLKNKIGMAFLPVLADVSGAMLGFAEKVLPSVVAGVERLSGFIRTATGVVKDMFAAVKGQQKGGGDFLASIIGPGAADAFMQTVTNVSLTLNHFWEAVIKPAFKWLQDNVPVIWGNVKDAIATAWTAIRPKLEMLRDTLQEVKDKFETLPSGIQQFALAFAGSALVVQQTGLDQTFGNIAGGALNLLGAVAALRDITLASTATFLLAAAPFVIIAGIIAGLVLIFLNFGEITKNVAGDFDGTFDGPVSKVKNLFSGLGSLVRGVLDGIGAAVGGLFSTIGTAVNDFLTFWEGAWKAFSDRPAYWLGVILAFAATKFAQLVTIITTFAVDALVAIFQFGVNAFDAVSRWIGDTAKVIWDFFTGLPGQVADWLGQVIALFQALPDQGVAAAADFVLQTDQTFTDWLLGLPGRFWDFAVQAVQGLINGFGSMKDTVWNAMTEFFGGLVDGVKAAMGIHSPSAIMAEIGKNMMAGLALGITTASPAMLAHMKAVTDEIIELGKQITSAVRISAGAVDAIVMPGSGGGFGLVPAGKEQIGTAPGGIPIFANGGVMPWTGLAHLEKGETVLKPGQSGGSITNVFNIGTVDSDARVRELASAIDDIFRRRRMVAGGAA